jgi:RNA-dependent RNA polymerase
VDDSTPACIIAHSRKHVAMFDRLNICWAVQWQIGVLLSSRHISWDDISEEKLRDLQGDNTTAGPKVSSLLLESQISISPRANIPWIELDKEAKALGQKRHENLGLTHVDTQEAHIGQWWGGRVEQVAVLRRVEKKRNPLVIRSKDNEPPPEYTVELRQHRVHGKSHRFARRWGSRRFIQLRLPDPLFQNDRTHLQAYLNQPFILHGRIFRAFFASEGVVHLVETSENWQRASIGGMGDNDRISLHEFLNWHIPLSLNSEQVKNLRPKAENLLTIPMFQLMSKLCSRFKLGLSTSIPAVIFDTENIVEIPDLCKSFILTV